MFGDEDWDIDEVGAGDKSNFSAFGSKPYSTFGGDFNMGHGNKGNRNGFGSGDYPSSNSCNNTDFIQERGRGRGIDNSSGGSATRSCFKCGEVGHMSRDCSSAATGSSGFGRGGGRSRGCFKCGEDGYMARDCHSDTSSGFGGGGERSKGCFKCGQDGHMARECPSGESSGFDGSTKGNRSYKHGDGENNSDRPPIYVPPPPPEEEKLMYSTVQTGLHFDNYDTIPVEVTGENPPGGISSFDEADLPETVRQNIRKANYKKPTPVQKYSIPIVNSDRDLMACAQTGSGKTAAFLLPVLRGMVKNGITNDMFSEKQLPQAVVVGPTRELVYQIFLETRKFSKNTIIKPIVAYGGTSVAHQLSQLSRGCNILIATPGRLLDFINRGKVGLANLQYLILDEADRMLDMGFEPEIRRLVAAPDIPDKYNRHTLMFSATFPNNIQELAHEFLRDDFLFLTVGRVGGACSDVTQTVLQVDTNDKREKLMQLIADVEETKARTLVFVDTKRNADFLACFLSQEGCPTTSIHGDRLQREREQALYDFKSGVCPILIATSVAARGLDIPKVEHVINFDLPSEIDEYVHRIGRTGRCGNLGQATSFYCDDKDGALARSLVKILADSQQEVPGWLENCAESAVGTSFGAGRGQFGARDARKAGFGRAQTCSRQTTDSDYNDGGGAGTKQQSGFDAFGNDESWD
uniref:RNA helicase n=1 Tax=Halocynthia roretzi TaxID=7729 RepID=B7U6Y7_HALRO|nr:vasa [Halocynthia roretzi]